jgi:hypothetical protein
MTIAWNGKLLIAPVADPTDAAQSVKVTFPKFAKYVTDCDPLPTDGLSTTHSADNREEL